ncbi:MAG: helix-turn-helix domain-containing protein [Thermoleophilia bacterium]
MTTDPWEQQVEALGGYIRAQRKLAKLSLRELANMSDVSNAYLSQLERGMHAPSMRVVGQVARALGMSPWQFLHDAGLVDETGRADAGPGGEDGGGIGAITERAILADRSLTDAQREALLAVLRSFGRG